MKGKRFSVEQMFVALKQAEPEALVADSIHKGRITEEAFYRREK